MYVLVFELIAYFAFAYMLKKLLKVTIFSFNTGIHTYLMNCRADSNKSSIA